MTMITKVAKRRMELELTQPQVAEKARVPLSTYQKIDNGANDFNKAQVNTAIRIARALQTTVEKLCDD